MNQEELAGVLEGILFTMGNTVETDRLMTALEVSREEIEAACNVLEKRYEADGSGIRLLRLEDALQLGTKPNLFEYLIRVAAVPKRHSISPAMLEVLSVVAYKQPVTRAEVERIRGVSCDYAVNRLVEYGLIEEVGRLDAPGRPILFATTEEFLRCFGLSSVTELPVMDSEQMEAMKREAEAEIGAGTLPSAAKEEEEEINVPI